MLYDDSRLMIVLTELTWRASLLFLEYSVEIAEVIKATVKPDFTDAFGCIYQHACRIAETKVDDILRKQAEAGGDHPYNSSRYNSSPLIYGDCRPQRQP